MAFLLVTLIAAVCFGWPGAVAAFFACWAINFITNEKVF